MMTMIIVVLVMFLSSVVLKEFFNDSEDKQIAFKESDYFEKIDDELQEKFLEEYNAKRKQKAN